MSEARNNSTTIIPIADEPQLRSVARRAAVENEEATTTPSSLLHLAVTASDKNKTLQQEAAREQPLTRKNAETTTTPQSSTVAAVDDPAKGLVIAKEEDESQLPPLSSEPVVVGEYHCDLIQEYQRTKGRCFLVLDDCAVDQVNAHVESFMTAVQETGKLLSFSCCPKTSSAKKSTTSAVPCPHHSCWDCQLSCGRVLIRTAELPPDDKDECRTTRRTRSLVQVHRCSGCCVGTHMLRQKLFQYLQQQQHCGSSSREEPHHQDGRVVPFDFLECTAAMRQDFQDRCRALLGSDRVDCQELARQALMGQKQL
jgi:hypothetical protein